MNQTRPSLKLALLLLGVMLLSFSASEMVPSPVAVGTPASTPIIDQWVDSIFNQMTPDERLGQLFMVRAHSDKDEAHVRHVESLIKNYHVGGLCFFQGTPEKQAELSNRFQALTTHVPLMIGIDGEWGLGMRMKKTTISFPRQLTLGAIRDNRLIYDMGKEIARQMERVGVNVNFAPVADINNNAANPVINTRSFGEDRYNVTVKSYMYMKGMQDHGVMACAKHFPGHGDTDVDSHHDLPIIPHSKERLDSIELYPFRALAQHGVGSMMVAHLNIPTLDDRPNRPTTLSKKTITNLLKEELNFNGLVFTDALEMKGVTKHYDSGIVEAEALLAGNDILLLPEDIEASFREIKRYVAEGKLDQAQLDKSIKKVLRSKYEMGMTNLKPLSLENVRRDLNTPEAIALKRKLIEHSLTLVRNRDNIIPFQQLDSIRLASLSIGLGTESKFQTRLDSYMKMEHFYVGKEISSSKQINLVNQLAKNDAVIVSLHDMSSYASRNFGITESTKQLIEKISQETRVVLVVFGSPYSLKYFDSIDWVLEAYEENEIAQDLSAQALFGAIEVSGRLPVTASQRSTFNTGLRTKKNFRMGFNIPEGVGLNSDTLAKIDALAQEAIESGATPGCVVLVAKKGQIVYHKSFGYHTYAKRHPVALDDIYDVASVTKIAASTLAIMKLQEEGLIDINYPLGNYLPELEGTNKADLIIKDILAHRAGLKSWIPFYEETVTKSRRNPRPMGAFYRVAPDETYSIPVTDRLYLRNDYADSIWYKIIHSELRPNRNYRYSDLGFYLMAKLVEKQTGKTLDRYIEDAFYADLGMQHTMFNPWQKGDLSHVPPTERDNYFRRMEVHGYVHDMGAAMLGGVSGHAGLFSNATDLAVMMQMLLQRGQYAGRRFLHPETIELFTTRFPGDSRRGIGFDMQQTDPYASPNMSPLATARTFGHLGFTGTCVWADPESELIYIFLSNRTYPSMRNYKLNKKDFRPRIQSVIYEAMVNDAEEDWVLD